MEQNNYSRILVTGGSGFIGSALVRNLSDNKIALRVLVRDLSKTGRLADVPSAALVPGDLLNPQSLENACSNQQVVVHLAGLAHVGRSDDGKSRSSIVEGTQILLDAAVQQGVKRFVYVSSSLAQAAGTGQGDDTAYGRLKKSAENILLEAHARGEIEVVILRPVNVYGVGMQGNIAKMISLIIRKRLPPLPSVDSRISLVGVTDLVQAMWLAINSRQAAGQVYTVTDGQEYKIVDIEQAVYHALGQRFPRWRTPRVIIFAAAFLAGIVAQVLQKGSAIGLRTYRNICHDNLFDNSKICAELGFRPGTTFYQEMPKIVASISQEMQRS